MSNEVRAVSWPPLVTISAIAAATAIIGYMGSRIDALEDITSMGKARITAMLVEQERHRNVALRVAQIEAELDIASSVVKDTNDLVRTGCGLPQKHIPHPD